MHMYIVGPTCLCKYMSRLRIYVHKHTCLGASTCMDKVTHIIMQTFVLAYVLTYIHKSIRPITDLFIFILFIQEALLFSSNDPHNIVLLSIPGSVGIWYLNI